MSQFVPQDAIDINRFQSHTRNCNDISFIHQFISEFNRVLLESFFYYQLLCQIIREKSYSHLIYLI